MRVLTRTLALFGVAITFALFGCDKEPSPGSSNTPIQSANDGHGDDPDHGAGAHENAQPGDAGDRAGDEHALGTITIGGTTLEVTISGAIEPNGEVDADIVHTGGPAPAAVRLWIGEESGVGSLKTKADGHDDHFHGRAEVPPRVPAGAALWIEVESASGERASAPLSLP